MDENDFLEEAFENLDKGEYYKLIELCNKAIEINKMLSDAYNMRGEAYRHLREYNEAYSDYSKAIDITSDRVDYYFDRFCLNSDFDKLEEAMVDITKAIELEPNNSFYYHERAKIEKDMGRFLEAAADYTKTININPSEDKYTERAYCYIELEEYDLAFADLNSSLQINPKSYNAYSLKAYIHMSLGNYKCAIENYEKVIDFFPDNHALYLEIGKCKAEMGKLASALKYINKAIRLNPSAENYTTRILAREKVLKMRQNIINLYEGKPVTETKENIIEIFNEKQALDDIKDLTKILELSPDSPYALSNRLDRHFYLKDYSNAFKDAERIIKLGKAGNSRIINILSVKGLSEFKLGQFEKSIEDLSKALIFEDNIKEYYYRAIANYTLKRYLQAFADIKKAYELNNDINFDFEDELPKAMKLFLLFLDKINKNIKNKIKMVNQN